MNCPKCKQRGTMINLNDPRNDHHVKKCIVCGQEWTPVRLTPSELAELTAKTNGVR